MNSQTNVLNNLVNHLYKLGKVTAQEWNPAVRHIESFFWLINTGRTVVGSLCTAVNSPVINVCEQLQLMLYSDVTIISFFYNTL